MPKTNELKCYATSHFFGLHTIQTVFYSAYTNTNTHLRFLVCIFMVFFFLTSMPFRQLLSETRVQSTEKELLFVSHYEQRNSSEYESTEYNERVVIFENLYKSTTCMYIFSKLIHKNSYLISSCY